MLADDDFRVCTTCRIGLHVVALPGLAQLWRQTQQRALEGPQHTLEKVVLPARIELAQALQRFFVEHRRRSWVHGVISRSMGACRGG